MPFSGIHIKTATGSELQPYLHSLAKLRLEVFREPPYLIERDFTAELEILSRYSHSPESIGVLIFDGSTLIGAALGTPLPSESPEILHPFLEHSLDPADYFFFDEPTLLKSHRGRGIGHHFFDLREAHVLQKTGCLAIVFRTHPPLALHDFWQKRGYVPLTSFNTPTMSYWIKELSPEILCHSHLFANAALHHHHHTQE